MQDYLSEMLCFSGPSSVQMENDDKAIATVTGLQIGTYRFRLTVKDQQGLSSAAVLSVTVKEGKPSCCCFLGDGRQQASEFRHWQDVKEIETERDNVCVVVFQGCSRRVTAIL